MKARGDNIGLLPEDVEDYGNGELRFPITRKDHEGVYECNAVGRPTVDSVTAELFVDDGRLIFISCY